MQPGDDAIPEAKVAFRGLLRRKRLAMTSRARNDGGGISHCKEGPSLRTK